MTEFTIEVSDDVAERVTNAVSDRAVTPEELVSQVVAERFPPGRRLGFLSLGNSTSARRATDDKSMHAEGFGR